MRFTTLQIAIVCHEANRALTEFVGDVPVQPKWENAPAEMKLSSVQGVEWRLANPGASPSAQHDEWMRQKIKAGWVHGPVKDEAKRTHPALVPYWDLPEGVRAKDTLFSSIVIALGVPT